MSVAIRAATMSDAEAIGRLAAEFQDYLRSLGDRTEFDFGASHYMRDGFGEDPAFAGLVAESGDAVVGYLLYHDGYETDHGRRVVHVIDLYVQAAWRRQGIGESLMRRAAEVGRARGAQLMLWSVYKPNALAMRFYEALGAKYIEDLHFMALNL
jgi:ribosomal protein S18 acetylase RimI-like enzyme